jgi:hypothetical protein
MKKLIYKISEEEKNRILGLHRKQVIIERSQNKKLLSESEIKILLREQQEKEVEVLLNSLSENDPPEKWQQIIDKVEDLGEDVVTFIKKMKNKQLGKKFGNFLKNNFNRVKFKQAGDKIVSFFNKLTGKKPQVTTTVTSTPTPTPTPTPEPEDLNAWKNDTEKQKEYLLKNGYTEDSLNSFIGKKSDSYGSRKIIETIDRAIDQVFMATYYEPITNTEDISLLNMPKTLDQYYDVIKTYGFKIINFNDINQIKNFFPKLNGYDPSKDGIQKYIASKTRGNRYTLDDNVYGNPKTKVITWYEDTNKVVRISQTEFTNNKTDQSTKFTLDFMATFPLIGSYADGVMNNISIANFEKYIITPDSYLVQFEEYEDEESIQKLFDFVRSWWAKDDGKGKSRYYNSNGKVYDVDTNVEFTDARSVMPRQAAKTDFDNLENKINQFFKDEELVTQLKKLEDLKNEARNIKWYE